MDPVYLRDLARYEQLLERGGSPRQSAGAFQAALADLYNKARLRKIRAAQAASEIQLAQDLGAMEAQAAAGIGQSLGGGIGKLAELGRLLCEGNY